MALTSIINQKGSTLLFGLFLILVLSLTAFLSLAYVTQLITQHHSRQICRTEVLTTQKVIKTPLKIIMLLNPVIALLKNINTMSTVAFLIPGLQEAALTVKLKAEQWLTYLSRLQQNLIKAIRAWVSARNFITQNKIRFFLFKQKIKNKTQSLHYQDIKIKINKQFPAIRRKDPQERFSEYTWAEPFEEKQAITLTWKIQWTEGLTYQLIRLLNFTNVKSTSSLFHLGCSATLKHIDPHKIEVRLFADPSLSNVRFFF